MNIPLKARLFLRGFKKESISAFVKFYIAYVFLAGLLRLLTTISVIENYHLLSHFYWEVITEGCLLILTIIIFFKDTKLNYSETLIAVLQIYMCVSFTFWNEEENFNYDFFQSQHFLLLPLIGNLNWKYNTASAFIVNSFNIFIISKKKESNSQTGFTIADFLLSSGFIALGSYLKQLYTRKLLLENEKDKVCLIHYQDLIKNVLPSSIVVIRNKKVIFQNLNTRRLLRFPKFMPIEEILNKIIINDVKVSNSECLFSEEKGKAEGKTRLLDYLVDDSKNIDFGCGFQEIYGELEEFNNFNMYNNISQTTRLIKAKASIILWEGEVALIVIMSEDFQGHKINSLTNQALYKDQILATVSHDLRTPLNGVIGMLEMALENISENALKKSLTIALRSSRLLLFMINDILDFSLISSGKLRLSSAIFDCVQCIKDVAKLIKFQAKRKGLNFELENKFNSAQHSFVRSDPNRIKQVILNLLSNALKFTQKGFIKVTLEPLDTPYSVKISVEDSGTGIKQEDIPKLFKVFGKLEGGDNDKLNSNGIGLGLAISQSLVRKLNNDSGEEMHVKSIYGKGTIFHFIIRDLKIKKKNCIEWKIK